MSKFLKKIAELTNDDKTPETAEDAALKKAEDDERQGNATPLQKQLLQKKRQLNQAIGNKLDKATQDLNTEAGPGDFPPTVPPVDPSIGAVPTGVPPVPPVPPVEPAEPEPLTTEGETFLVNLARRALFVDINEVGLTDLERESINKNAKPKNSKRVAKIIRKIIVDYGLDESFTSKVDVVIEDLKKNGRVVVLVPGSFKPPHKGHYEMVRQYSEAYPNGQIQVLISNPAGRNIRKTKDNKVITPEVAKQIFDLYVVNLRNVEVIIPGYNSPVTAAYETLRTFPPGTNVILGASKKDDDWKRWSYAIPWAEKQGLQLNIEDPLKSAVDVVMSDGGRPYSADNIRRNFDNFEAIRPDIPDHVEPEAIEQIFDEIEITLPDEV